MIYTIYPSLFFLSFFLSFFLGEGKTKAKAIKKQKNDLPAFGMRCVSFVGTSTKHSG